MVQNNHGSRKEQEYEAQAETGEPPPKEEERQADDILENQSREVYSPETQTADFRKLRVTDMKDNPRVFLPKPRPPGEERVMASKDVLREEAIQAYIYENCIEKGFQKDSNLTKQQQRGPPKAESQNQNWRNNHK